MAPENILILTLMKKYSEIYTGKFKIMPMCNLYNVHRFWELKNWIINNWDVADDAWVKNQSEETYQLIFLRICFGNDYLAQCVKDIYWFERRGIQSHLACDV